MVTDPLEATRDDDHAAAPLALRYVGGKVENALHGAAVGRVDQLVEVDERRGSCEIAALERDECDANHLLRALTHLLECLNEPLVLLGVGGELRQLGNRDAVAAHPLEMEIRVHR